MLLHPFAFEIGDLPFAPLYGPIVNYVYEINRAYTLIVQHDDSLFKVVIFYFDSP